MDTETIAHGLATWKAIERSLASVLAEDDLRVDQWRLLTLLRERPGLYMGEVAEALSLPNASTTRLVDDMASSSLVFRAPAPEDGRKAVVYLSRTGRERLARADAVVAARFEGLDAQALDRAPDRAVETS
ncbi:MarR family winged helix-turn-helix transcriptional regulator [Brevibacterium litoralis]|uniref:MarR family winged helix-turn-helix transcriptional regulator n=1 Tax=Brevibacterium litoralis TaxID=3138935 RepID=UPI0032EC91B4